jgi:hypothetical protein
VPGGGSDVVVRGEEIVTTRDGQVSDEGIARADLNTSGAQCVANAGRRGVVLARGRVVLQRSEHFDDLRPGSFRYDALEQFLQNYPGGCDDLTTGQRIAQRPDLGHIGRGVSAQRKRPDARVDQQAHRRELSDGSIP